VQDDGADGAAASNANQVGADIAIQLMLMTLFACVASLTDNADAFKQDIRDKLNDVVATVPLPTLPPELEDEVREAAQRVVTTVLTGAEAIEFPQY
jgi:hypothetical protein